MSSNNSSSSQNNSSVDSNSQNSNSKSTSTRTSTSTATGTNSSSGSNSDSSSSSVPKNTRDFTSPENKSSTDSNSQNSNSTSKSTNTSTSSSTGTNSSTGSNSDSSSSSGSDSGSNTYFKSETNSDDTKNFGKKLKFLKKRKKTKKKQEKDKKKKKNINKQRTTTKQMEKPIFFDSGSSEFSDSFDETNSTIKIKEELVKPSRKLKKYQNQTHKMDQKNETRIKNLTNNLYSLRKQETNLREEIILLTPVLNQLKWVDKKRDLAEKFPKYSPQYANRRKLFLSYINLKKEKLKEEYREYKNTYTVLKLDSKNYQKILYSNDEPIFKEDDEEYEVPNEQDNSAKYWIKRVYPNFKTLVEKDKQLVLDQVNKHIKKLNKFEKNVDRHYQNLDRKEEMIDNKIEDFKKMLKAAEDEKRKIHYYKKLSNNKKQMIHENKKKISVAYNKIMSDKKKNWDSHFNQLQDSISFPLPKELKIQELINFHFSNQKLDLNNVRKNTFTEIDFNEKTNNKTEFFKDLKTPKKISINDNYYKKEKMGIKKKMIQLKFNFEKFKKEQEKMISHFQKNKNLELRIYKNKLNYYKDKFIASQNSNKKVNGMGLQKQKNKKISKKERKSKTEKDNLRIIKKRFNQKEEKLKTLLKKNRIKTWNNSQLPNDYFNNQPPWLDKKNYQSFNKIMKNKLQNSDQLTYIFMLSSKCTGRDLDLLQKSIMDIQQKNYNQQKIEKKIFTINFAGIYFDQSSLTNNTISKLNKLQGQLENKKLLINPSQSFDLQIPSSFHNNNKKNKNKNKNNDDDINQESAISIFDSLHLIKNWLQQPKTNFRIYCFLKDINRYKFKSVYSQIYDLFDQITKKNRIPLEFQFVYPNFYKYSFIKKHNQSKDPKFIKFNCIDFSQINSSLFL
ncbi:keratinocyte proline-rich protein [Anaeramoeba flamelloides]|uniref:Keratinocyte proline-rich protein n=1 Tax=Anaeramoeba flamelloides TaxID=1746091 RepID=A0ABQ8XLS6_9EUKA|nr:keratinocyte proline-rich protein [Anaeramoeba flamelloides]